MPLRPGQKIAAVIVTHKRRELLARSLTLVATQTEQPTWVIVVDNGNEPEVKTLVETTCHDAGVTPVYLASQHNLGGAGGFAYGFLTALALGADSIFCADDDGRPEDTNVIATLTACAQAHGLEEVSAVVANDEEPDLLAFPLRRGLVWRRRRSELWAHGEDRSDDLLPGIASLFNGALISKEALDRVGVPDLRLFIRGDEVEFHRRLVRSGLPFGTCLTTAYLHPNGSDEFKPILGGRMHTQYPDNPGKRYFTYRNRGYLMNQPGMRRLLVQEYLRFGWFFLVQRRDVKGFVEWFRLHRLGRKERFGRPDQQ